MTDKEFNFSFNFSDQNTLPFSVSTLLGTYSMNSGLGIDTSIQSSVAQNLIFVNYTKDGVKTELQATISTISIMRDFAYSPTIIQYAVVLSGNSISKADTPLTLYIVIPFVIQAENNGTVNSKEIEKIVLHAKARQFEEGLGKVNNNTIFLNNLITPTSVYYYSVTNTFTTAIGATSFVIYKKDPGVISNSSPNLLDLFNKGTFNFMKGDFNTNTFTPLILDTPGSNEIMIDCAPVEITTDNENVMFKSKNTIYGNFENNPTTKIVLTIIFSLIGVGLLLLFGYKISALWRHYFGSPEEVAAPGAGAGAGAGAGTGAGAGDGAGAGTGAGVRLRARAAGARADGIPL